jgi:hypothetical protein
MTYECPRIAGVLEQVFDCGGDDYFNVAPADGTYLATSFNVYDNAYLGACDQVAPACGGEATVPDSNPQPPVPTGDPAISGEARVGATLGASTGQWANAPAGYAYQWQRGDGSTWGAILGAEGASYTATDADRGLRLRVRVIASNADGSMAAHSAATAVVAARAGTTGTTTTTGTDAGLPTAPAAGASAPRSGRAALRIAAGRGRGKRLGTIAFRISGGRLATVPARVRLARGTYGLRLCTTAGASASKPRCATRRLKVARSARTRLPALALPVPAGVSGRASYTIKAVGRTFSALTAKRPGIGLLLRG